jgi:hypothetical protein
MVAQNPVRGLAGVVAASTPLSDISESGRAWVALDAR